MERPCLKGITTSVCLRFAGLVLRISAKGYLKSLISFAAGVCNMLFADVLTPASYMDREAKAAASSDSGNSARMKASLITAERPRL